MKRTLLTASAALLLATLVGCSQGTSVDDDVDEVVETAAQTAEPSPTPAAPDGSQSRPLDVGTQLEVNAGGTWIVTVDNLTADGNDLALSSSQFLEIPDGFQYVTGDLSATLGDNPPADVVGQPATIRYSVSLVFVGSDGQVYDVHDFANGHPPFPEDGWRFQPESIASAGMTETGPVGILVPEDAVPGGQFAVEIMGELVYVGQPV